MLSLPKKERGFQATQDSLDLSRLKSFDQILDSMQGLSHLVQDVSLDKIVEADNKAKQLLQRLSSLQSDLTLVKEIKRCLAQSNRAISRGEGVREPNVTPKNLSNNQETRPPNNLIPFPGPTKISNSSPSYLKPAAQDTPCDEANSVAEDPPAMEPSQTAKGSQDHVPGNDQHLTIPPTNSTPISEPQQAQEKEIEPEFPPPEIEAQEQENRQVNKDIPYQIQTPPTETDETTAQHRSIASSVKEKIEFDQKLLRDLIKDYGEFVTYTKLSPDNTRNTPATPKRQNQSSHKSTESPVRNETMGQRDRDHDNSDPDFDQKLKKLITDYGKVDIYADCTVNNRQSTIKKGVIAALVLVVVSLASYFFFSFYQPQESTPPFSPETVTFRADTEEYEPIKYPKVTNPKSSFLQAIPNAELFTSRSAKQSSVDKER